MIVTVTRSCSVLPLGLRGEPVASTEPVGELDSIEVANMKGGPVLRNLKGCVVNTGRRPNLFVRSRELGETVLFPVFLRKLAIKPEWDLVL